jgi:hypothetical protein
VVVASCYATSAYGSTRCWRLGPASISSVRSFWAFAMPRRMSRSRPSWFVPLRLLSLTLSLPSPVRPFPLFVGDGRAVRWCCCSRVSKRTWHARSTASASCSVHASPTPSRYVTASWMVTALGSSAATGGALLAAILRAGLASILRLTCRSTPSCGLALKLSLTPTSPGSSRASVHRHSVHRHSVHRHSAYFSFNSRQCARCHGASRGLPGYPAALRRATLLRVCRGAARPERRPQLPVARAATGFPA